MIITLVGANFSESNIGTLSTWRISTVLGNGATYNGVTSIDKDPVTGLNATVTIAEGYELGTAGVTVTMGGTPVTSGITVDGNTITINIAAVTGNVVIKVPTVNTATGEEGSGNGEGEGGSGDSGTTTLTLYQGYANENNIAPLDTRVRTDFIEGAFSVECNSGYVIRAIYEYSSPKATSGTSIVSASENKTSYTGGTTGKYYIITFCKSDATASISPTENIVANFTGTIYSGGSGDSGSGDSGSDDGNTTGETIDVNGIRITMGQLISSGIKTHAGRAYTVDKLNDKTTISTSGSNFVMIPIMDTDNDLSNSGTITCYTNTDGSFATSSSAGGTLQYHNTINIADIKALDSSANVYVMFKHSSASTFALSDLASAVTIN